MDKLLHKEIPVVPTPKAVLKYLNKEDLSKCVNNNNVNFCFACFDGNYPIELADMDPEIS